MLRTWPEQGQHGQRCSSPTYQPTQQPTGAGLLVDAEVTICMHHLAREAQRLPSPILKLPRRIGQQALATGMSATRFGSSSNAACSGGGASTSNLAHRQPARATPSTGAGAICERVHLMTHLNVLDQATRNRHHVNVDTRNL
jgi:hypothetical protein